MRRKEREINSVALSTASFNIQEMLQNKYDISKGERILSVQVRVTLGDEGYIIKEEVRSLMDEYNNILRDNDFKEYKNK